MSTKIEYTQEVKFGDHEITSITVAPLRFMGLCDIWSGLRQTGDKVRSELQRARILHQTTFKAGDKVIVPDIGQLGNMPTPVAKQIIDALDIGSGPGGKLLASGDGMGKPVLYELGTPIEMKSGDGAVTIKELEFIANTYAEAEDLLAAGNDAEKAKFLLRDIANPVEVKTLNRLPGWALDRLTVGDGVQVMNLVVPLF